MIHRKSTSCIFTCPDCGEKIGRANRGNAERIGAIHIIDNHPENPNVKDKAIDAAYVAKFVTEMKP